jgi:hypothetical protein
MPENACDVKGILGEIGVKRVQPSFANVGDWWSGWVQGGESLPGPGRSPGGALAARLRQGYGGQAGGGGKQKAED